MTWALNTARRADRPGSGAAAVTLAGAALWAMIGEAQENAGLFPYDDAEAVARGAALYAENCAACHGEKLQGEDDWRGRNENGSFRSPPHDETGHTWHHPDAQLFAITKFGTEEVTGGAVISDMAGFGDVLDDQQILDVLAFIKAQWPEKIISRHNDLNAQYEANQ